MKILNVTAREIKVSASNGKSYAVIQLSTPASTMVDINGTMTRVKLKPESVRGITGFEVSNLPSLKDQPDYEWTLEVGEVVQGDRVTRKVEPYFIPDSTMSDKSGNPVAKGPVVKDGKTGRMVDTATCAVLADTDDKEGFEIAILNAFKRKNHKLAAPTVAQVAAPATAALTPEQIAAESEASAAAMSSK